MQPAAALLASYGFDLDPFQRRAIEALDTGQSVLVAAPTGSGKTVVAEYAIELALAAGGKAFYTAPIKALSNQKFGDLSRRYGHERVGLLTGDNSVNGSAPVVVMTTEVLRNMIYAGSSALDGLRVVVLDEVHYLQDAYRGPVWEEVILHLPDRVRLVCLSATVSNAEELADWITTVRGPTAAVIEEHRPVELVNLYCVGDRSSPTLHLLPTLVDGAPNAEASRLDAASLHAPPRRGRRATRRRGPPARHLLHLQPRRLRRCGRRLCRRRVAAHGDRRTGAHPRAGRGARRVAVRRRPRRARLRPLAHRPRAGDRRAPRGHGPTVQENGRSVLRRRAGEERVRDRDARARHQHARPNRGHREPVEVHGRASRVPQCRRVHAAHRARRPTGDRPGRLRGGPVVAVRAVRAGGLAGVEPRLPAAVRLPAHLQHGGQPRGAVRAGRSAPAAEPVVRAVPDRPVGGAARDAPRKAQGR